MSIGPSLPPHLQRLREQANEEEEENDEVGPRLPTVACRGPKPPSPGEQEDEEESSDDDFGPALPPHLANRLQAAPEPSGAVVGVGAEEGVGGEAEDDSGSEDDGIGPKPPKPGEGGSVLLSQMSDLERRAQSMRDKIEGKGKEEVKRESWMLELPGIAKKFGLGARQFSRKGITQVGDRSAWTDSPEAREKRARGEIEEVEEEDSKEYLINKARDEAMDKVTQELKQKRGTETLVDIHEKKMKKKKDKEEPTGRRPFDRDLDLGANKFDEAQRKLMIKKAAQIDSRFSTGAKKFL